jgi:hypothetical protein
VTEAIIGLLGAFIGAVLGAWASQRATRLTLEHDRQVHLDNLRFEYIKHLMFEFVELYSRYVPPLSGREMEAILNKARGLIIASGDKRLIELSQNFLGNINTEDEEERRKQIELGFITLFAKGLVIFAALIAEFEAKREHKQ